MKPFLLSFLALALVSTSRAAMPTITSPLTATAAWAQPFSYPITASGSPTSFSATGLPPGLSVNPTTGLISGTPTVPGTNAITLSADNAEGSGTATLTLAIVPPIKAIAFNTTGTLNPGRHITFW